MTTITAVTDEERAQRRAADREYAKQAIEALRTSEGWQRWLTARASFHHYSLANQLLIAMQRPDATRVAGFRAWLKLGYCVRKGEKSIRIWAPCPPSPNKIDAWRKAGSKPEERPRTFFKLSAVFANDQVDALPPPAVPAPLSPPISQLTGDDLANCIAPLTAFAKTIGSTVTLTTVAGAASGYYEPATKRIVVDSQLPVNNQVSVLCHELAHALVRADEQPDDPKLNYASEELVAESVAFTVVRSLGIVNDRSSIPYLASWAGQADLSALEKLAVLIDRLARCLEDIVLPVLAE